jgi:hypothetical protein
MPLPDRMPPCAGAALFILLAAWGGHFAGAEDSIRVECYPTAGELPANHLKFYLHFSRPMREGGMLESLGLFRLPSGEAVAEPFRETELWNDTGERLTLWLHPGRQKTGVNLNVELGPVLEEGGEYELRTVREWQSRDGGTLVPGVLKRFRAGPAARARLQVTDWEFPVLVPIGTRAPVVIRFPGPMDRALLLRCVHLVTKDKGDEVPGKYRVEDGDAALEFIPDEPWRAGAASGMRWRVRTVLEDLAGNSLARPFERDLLADPGGPVPEMLLLPFQGPGT